MGARWVTCVPLLLGGVLWPGPGTASSAAREQVRPPLSSAPRIECPQPRTLRLRRFEDGSAQLRCAGRVIARISVPG